MIDDWHNHPMRTVGKRSPKQLWHSGMCAASKSDYFAVQSAFLGATDWREFGIELGWSHSQL